MKNKWKVLVILLLLILINPKTFSILSESLNKKSTDIETITSIDISSDFDFIEYDGNLVFYNDNSIKSVNKNGEEVFKLNLNFNNINLESNKFIDILDKESNTVYSIDKKGKVAFKKNMKKDSLIYKSIENDSYIYAYRKENKNIVNIYDYEFNLIKSINIDGMITDIEYSSNQIYIASINTEKKLNGTVACYDYNGNLKDKKDTSESIVIDLIKESKNIYSIETNKITKMDMGLKIINEFPVKDIKAYSNIYKDSIYVIEADGNVKFINKDVKPINMAEKNLTEVINFEDIAIFATNNKLITKKGVELKSFKEKIKHIELIEENILIVQLENSIHVINIK